MNRLTTDNPKTNLEVLLNYAYAEDGKAILRYGDGEYDVELCDYIERVAREELHCENCNVSEGFMECDCIASVLFAVATQAAELRARLKMFEDEAQRRLENDS